VVLQFEGKKIKSNKLKTGYVRLNMSNEMGSYTKLKSPTVHEREREREMHMFV